MNLRNIAASSLFLIFAYCPVGSAQEVKIPVSQLQYTATGNYVTLTGKKAATNTAGLFLQLWRSLPGNTFGGSQAMLGIHATAKNSSGHSVGFYSYWGNGHLNPSIRAGTYFGEDFAPWLMALPAGTNFTIVCALGFDAASNPYACDLR